MKRVVVTGMGIVSPIGCGVGNFFGSLLAARSGVRLQSYVWGQALVAPVLDDVDTPFPKIRRLSLDRVTQMALLAVRQATEQAQIAFADNSDYDAGIFWGTGMGGASTLEHAYRELLVNKVTRVRPSTIVAFMNNAAAGQIAIEYGIRGPSFTYSSACSSSAAAIGEAFRAVRSGSVKTAIAGGAEALLTEGVIVAWESLQTLARPDAEHPETSCRPFSADRSGFVLGEGAAALVLEDAEAARARGAVVLAEIAGYGNTTDASHITLPDAGGQAAAMTQAIADAEMSPDGIAHINAHGTGTKAGDVSETNAIKKVFGDRAYAIPASATKALHGHLMGATGAVEFVATVEALRTRSVPPTAHLLHQDAECDLDYVAAGPRKLEKLDAAMTNSFGFGGNNVALVVRRYG